MARLASMRAAFLFTAIFWGATIAQAPTATAHNGKFVGTTSQIQSSPTSITVKQFFGIPFANKPGEYQRPVKASDDSSIRSATQFGAPCTGCGGAGAPPVPLLPERKNVPSPQPHDCLFLNVYTPSNAKVDSGLAVMFYIYGGGFQCGSSDVRMYDGSFLAGTQDIIVVTFNYRLIKYGWPGSAGCNVPEGDRNLAMFDTMMALDWVQQNIEAFGGDPTRVTVFSQSAGAMMADLIAVQKTPQTVPFQAVILESGTYYIADLIRNDANLSTNDNPASNSVGNPLSGPFSNSTETAKMIRRKATKMARRKATKIARRQENSTSVEEVECLATYHSRPVEDGGITVPRNFHGQQIRSSGGGARVPILAGSNANEAILFLTNWSGRFESYYMSWDWFFGTDYYPELQPSRENIIDAYETHVHCDSTATAAACEWYRVSIAITDYIYTCPAARGARANAEQGIPTWRYVYNTTYGGYPWGDYSLHGFEVPQVFGTFDPNKATPAQKSISKAMMSAWAKFAKDPDNGPGWDKFTADSSSKVGLMGPTKDAGNIQPKAADTTDYACALYEQYYAVRDP